MEGKERSKKWWILAAAGAAVIVAAVLLILLIPKKTDPQESSVSETEHVSETETEADSTEEPRPGEIPSLWYNVDYQYYTGGSEGGLSSREKEEDGLWHFLLSVDGVQKDYTTSEIRIVNFIDSREFLVVTADEDGRILNAEKAEKYGYQVALGEGYVEEFLPEEGKIIVNSSRELDAFTVTVPLTEPWHIYDTENFENPAPEVEIERGRKLTVWENKYISDQPELFVYLVTAGPEPRDMVYWNVDRMWDTAILNTTREPNEDGVYEMKVYHDGGEMIIKTKNRDLVKKIDSYASRCFAATFDKKGYLMSVTRCHTPFGGKGVASWYDVLRFENEEGTVFFSKKTASGADHGQEETVEMSDECQVINVSSSYDDHPGEYTDLRLYDRVHVIVNADEKAVVVFVVTRRFDSPTYWNVERQYDSTTKTSKRTPDASGYYSFVMATGGKQVTVRTKDKTIADAIDVVSVRLVGLKLNGDIIEKVYKPAVTQLVGNYGSLASWFDVEAFTNAQGTKLRARKNASGADHGQVAEVEFAPDVKIYNVSTNHNAYSGEPSTVLIGDRIHCIKDAYGRARLVYIVSRPIVGDVIWNVTRKYDSTSGQTKRTPNAEGYYTFEVSVNGELKEVRTKDIALASKIDSYKAHVTGIVLAPDGVTITKVVGTSALKGYGGSSSSWFDVISINGKRVQTKKVNDPKSSDYLKVNNETLAADAKIYNVSGFYDGEEGHRVGEPTTLRVGDVVHIILNENDQAALVYVVGRSYQVIAHKDSHNCPDCGKSVEWTPWTAESSLPTETGHYYLCGNVTLTGQTGPAENQNVVLCLNGFTVTGPDTARAVSAFGAGSSLTIIGSVAGSTIKAGAYQDPEGGSAGLIGWDRNGDFKIFGGTYDASRVKTPRSASAFFLQGGHKMEIHDAVIIGGEAALAGGVISVVNGDMLLENVTIRGGAGLQNRDIINVEEKGNLTLKGRISFENIADGMTDLYLNNGKITLDGLTSDHPISVRMSANGAFTTNYEENSENLFVHADGEYFVVKAGDALKLSDNHKHCACGTDTFDGHTHETAEWDAWTKTDSLPKTAGHWYLKNDVTMSAEQIYQNVSGVYICLNGHTVTSTREGRAIRIEENVEMVISDCQGGGIIQNVAATSGSSGGVFSVAKSSTLAFYGITLDASAQECNNGSVIFAEQADASVYLDGCTIRGGSVRKNGGAIWAGGPLYILNTKISGGRATAEGTDTGLGGNVYLSGSPEVVIAGTTEITGGEAQQGGNIMIKGARKLTIADGVRIEGGIALTNQGGNIYLNSKATLNVEGGIIRQGIARNSGGGNIFVSEDATLHMTGGTVEAGFAKSNGYNIQTAGAFIMDGGIVGGKGLDQGVEAGNYSINTSDEKGMVTVNGGVITMDLQNVRAGASITVNGGRVGGRITAYRGTIYITGGAFGGKLNATESTGGAIKIMGGVFVLEPLASMIDPDSELTTGTFSSDDPDDTTVYPYTVTVNSHKHCICGTDDYDGHTHETVGWTAWTGTDSLPVTAGHWYLANDVTMSAEQLYQNVSGVYICLNGHTVTSTREGRAIRFEENVELTICDCQGGGIIQNVATSSGISGGIFSMGILSTLTCYGITLDASAHENTNGGVIFAEKADSSVYLNGCTVKGGSAKKNGGAIWAGGPLYLIDTKISGGRATVSGTDVGLGGNIYLSGSPEVVFEGKTEILGGEAQQGGNIMIKGARTLTIGDGVRIEGGVALTNQGGNIYLNSKATLNVEGGIIRQGISRKSTGGNIFVNENATLHMTGGTVEAGFAKSNGYNISVNGTFVMDGGVIGGKGLDQGVETGNYSINTGSETGVVTVNGGVITMDLQNVRAGATITLNGGRVGGRITAYRGTVHINGGAVGGKLSATASNGGAVAIKAGIFALEPQAAMIDSNSELSTGTFASDDPDDTTVYPYRVTEKE